MKIPLHLKWMWQIFNFISIKFYWSLMWDEIEYKIHFEFKGNERVFFMYERLSKTIMIVYKHHLIRWVRNLARLSVSYLEFARLELSLDLSPISRCVVWKDSFHVSSHKSERRRLYDDEKLYTSPPHGFASFLKWLFILALS